MLCEFCVHDVMLILNYSIINYRIASPDLYYNYPHTPGIGNLICSFCENISCTMKYIKQDNHFLRASMNVFIPEAR